MRIELIEKDFHARDGTSATPVKKARSEYVESKGLSRAPAQHEQIWNQKFRCSSSAGKSA